MVWHRTYLPGGISHPSRQLLTAIAPHGQQALIEGGLFNNPSVYDFDGKLQWTFQPQLPHETAMYFATAPNLSLYIGTNKNRLYAYDPQGALRWSVEAPGTRTWVCCPALAPDGTIYVTASDGVLFSVSPAGRINWRKAFAGLNGRRPPVIGTDGTIYVQCSHSALLALAPDGTEKWRTPDGESGIDQPLLLPGGLIVVNRERTGCLSAYEAGGQLAWKYNYQNKAGPCQPIAGPGGTIYLTVGTSQDSAEVVAVDTSGHERWRRPAGKFFSKMAVSSKGDLWLVKCNYSAPIASPQTPLAKPILSAQCWLQHVTKRDQAEIVVLDTGGRLVSRTFAPYMFTESAPVALADGSMLVLGTDGELYCYKR